MKFLAIWLLQSRSKFTLPRRPPSGRRGFVSAELFHKLPPRMLTTPCAYGMFITVKMKLKKWLALALSAVMAVGVLAGCGGGSTGGGSLDLEEVNSLISTAGGNMTVRSLDKLDDGLRSAVSTMRDKEVATTLAANEALADSMDWTSPTALLGAVQSVLNGQLPDFDGSLSYGAAYVISEERLENGVKVSGLADLVGIDSEKIAKLGTVDTPESLAAALILGVDEAIKEAAAEFLGDQASVLLNAISLDYRASARKMTLDGVTYWVLGGQVSLYTL